VKKQAAVNRLKHEKKKKQSFCPLPRGANQPNRMHALLS